MKFHICSHSLMPFSATRSHKRKIISRVSQHLAEMHELAMKRNIFESKGAFYIFTLNNAFFYLAFQAESMRTLRGLSQTYF